MVAPQAVDDVGTRGIDGLKDAERQTDELEMEDGAVNEAGADEAGREGAARDSARESAPAMDEIPRALVKRIVKRTIAGEDRAAKRRKDGRPVATASGAREEGQCSREAAEAIGESATIFLHYLVSHANFNAQEKKRGTVKLDDVHAALEETGFNEIMAVMRQAEQEEVVPVTNDDAAENRGEAGEEGEAGGTAANLDAPADGAEDEGDHGHNDALPLPEREGDGDGVVEGDSPSEQAGGEEAEPDP